MRERERSADAAERILVIDDEPGVRSALERILVDEGFFVVGAGSGEEGLETIRQQSFDAVLLDVWLPGIDGLETLKRLRSIDADAAVVMISGHGTIETAVRATKLGAFDFIEKPLSLERTLLVLRNALRLRRLERRNRRLLEQIARETEVTGRSAAAEKLRDEVEVAIATDAPVLICGEPGSGRESVARRIHSSGTRADGPFVAIPCTGLEPGDAVAVLFAERSRIDLAMGGSLFLASIDRLGSELQERLAARLLGLEQERFPPRRLASADPEPTRLGRALQDCLDVVRIRVPALRERREDVPLLVERMLADLAREYGRPGKRLSSECLATLKAHAWPGNLRELQNLVERLYLFSHGEVVECSDLPEDLGGAGPPAADLYREFDTLADGLAAFERYFIARVLAEERADRARAADRLGLELAELERRLGRGGSRGRS